MFGSQSISSHQNNSFFNQNTNIQSNISRLQFFASLFETNQITYLDPAKYYCIIETQRYNKIKAELTISISNQQAFQKKAYQTNLINIGLRKEIHIYQQEIEKINKNHRFLSQQYEKISQRCKQYQKAYQNFQHTTKRNQFSEPRFFSDDHENKNRFSRISQQNQECQTLAQINSDLVSQIENKVQKISQKVDIQAEQHKLYQLLQSQMEHFEIQFSKKLAALQSAKQQIDEWEQQNRQLKKENQELKQRIIDRNIQQQKLKIWRQNISDFVSKVQSSMATKKPDLIITNQEVQPTNQQVSYLKEEVLQLQGRIIEMKRKFQRIDEIIESDSQINDEGVIGTLVKLTHKVKGVVRNMIMEVQQI